MAPSNKTSDFVVAHHPRHPEAVGGVVSAPAYVAKESSRGAVFLPIDKPLLLEQKIGGFLRRSWGIEGWPFMLNRGEPGSPIALQVQAGLSYVHWAAGLTRAGSGTGQGKLQLWCDHTSSRVLNSGLSKHVEAPPFVLPLDGSEVIVRGVSQFNGAIDGVLGLGLWGVCSGVSVSWLAVSNSVRPE
jgi:hypothetical protein